MTNPQEFIALTEGKLLEFLGERIHEFFEDYRTIHTPWDECQKDAGELKQLYQKSGDDTYTPLPATLQKLLKFERKEVNPAAAVKPIAQLNMTANATFHLMAQQVALVCHEIKTLNRDKVLETTFKNIKNLVDQYTKDIRNYEANGKGPQDRGPG